MKVERIAEPIVVTGATGFIGRSLVNRLLEEGYRKVRALVLPADPLPRAWLGPEPGRDRVDIVRGDVTRLGDVAAVMGDAKTVFHLAAKVGDWGHPEEHHRITVMGTEHVLGEAARRQARVIMTSSVVVYGRQIGQKVCDEQTPMGAPLGPYSASKQAQERCGLRLEASHGLKLTVVRPTNVYGPGSIPWVHEAAKALQRGLPALIGGGRHDAGLTYVDNVVDVLVRAAGRPGTVGRIFNANDDHGTTWYRYFSDLARMVGAKPPRSIPRPLAFAMAGATDRAWRAFRRNDRAPLTKEAFNLLSSHHRVPITRAERDLGYRPLVSYDDGMRRLDALLSGGREEAEPMPQSGRRRAAS